MRIALPLAALLAIAAPAFAQDVAPVDGKPGTDIVSAGKVGDVRAIALAAVDLGLRSIESFAVTPGNAHLCALGRKRPRSGQADAAVAPKHDHDLVLEPHPDPRRPYPQSSP